MIYTTIPTALCTSGRKWPVGSFSKAPSTAAKCRRVLLPEMVVGGRARMESPGPDQAGSGGLGDDPTPRFHPVKETDVGCQSTHQIPSNKEPSTALWPASGNRALSTEALPSSDSG
jgi:hypothetical protein